MQVITKEPLRTRMLNNYYRFQNRPLLLRYRSVNIALGIQNTNECSRGQRQLTWRLHTAKYVVSVAKVMIMDRTTYLHRRTIASRDGVLEANHAMQGPSRIMAGLCGSSSSGSKQVAAHSKSAVDN